MFDRELADVLDGKRQGMDCSVRVVDVHGNAVSGAYLLQRSGARRIEADHPSVIGVSNDSGVAELPVGHCQGNEEVIVVHSDYLSARATLGAEDGGVREITLLDGHEQLFRGKSVAGESVSFSVWMSRAVLPAECEYTNLAVSDIPSADDRCSIRTGSSGGGEYARVSGMSAGRYVFSIAAPDGMVAVQCSKPTYVASVPGDVIDVTFAPVYVFALEPIGDSAISCWFLQRAPWKMSGIHSRIMDVYRVQLEGAFPNASVSVAALLGAEGDPAVAEVLLARTGRHRIEVPGVAWKSFVAPQSFDVSDLPDRPVEEVVVNVYDSTRQPVPFSAIGNDLVLVEGEGLGAGYWIFPDASGRFYVEAGVTHRLVTTKPYLRSVIPELEVVAPSSVDVFIDVALRSCRLVVELPWGELADEVAWSISTPIGVVTLREVDGNPATPLLPVGDLTVKASVFGFEDVVSQVSVQPAQWDDVLEIRMVVR